MTGQKTAFLTGRSIADRRGSAAKRSFHRRGVRLTTSLPGVFAVGDVRSSSMKPLVAVHQGAVNQLNSLPLVLTHSVEAESLLGDFQGPVGHVHADDFGEPPLP